MAGELCLKQCESQALNVGFPGRLGCMHDSGTERDVSVVGTTNPLADDAASKDAERRSGYVREALRVKDAMNISL